MISVLGKTPIILMILAPILTFIACLGFIFITDYYFADDED